MKAHLGKLTTTFAVFASIAASLTPALASAQTRKVAQTTPAVPAATAPQGTPEKLDVSDLEKKYWAAKDTDFSVVQNRLFSKAGRFSLAGQYGFGVNDPWSETPTYSGTLGYYFSERWGMELNYAKTDASDNKATQAVNLQGGQPNHGKIGEFYGASVTWVPLYAKMSLLNSKIIYFDMSVNLGGGVTQYTQQTDYGKFDKTAPTLTLDVTQTFFLTNWLALRLDLKNRWFQEEVLYYKQSSANAAGTKVINNDLNQTTFLMFGLNLYY